jgi:hypothetical protein
VATGNYTITTAEKHIGEVWPGSVIRAEEFNLVIAPRVYRKWKFAGHGDVYHIPRIPNIEAETKAASTSATMRTYTDTEQTITINVHQVAGFEVEDIVKLLSNTDVASEMKRKIGYSLGRALDVNLATLPQNFSQIVGTLGVELTYDNFIRAWQYLADAGILLTDQCTFFVSPAAQAGLLKQEIFINALYQGDDKRAVNTAKIGNILGAPVLMSNLTRAPSAGQSESWLQYHQAIGLIMAQEPKIVTEYIAKDLANVVVGHQVYGYAEIDRYEETPGNVTAGDNWAVLLRTVG